MHVPSFLLDFRFRTAHFALQRLTGLVRHRAGRLARALAAVLAFAAAGVFAFTDVGRCNGLHMFHGCLPSQRGANPPIVFFLYLYNKTRARARGRVPGGQIQWPRSLMGRRPTPRQRECLPLESPHKGMNLLLCLAAFSPGRASALVPLGNIIPSKPCFFATLAGMRNCRPQTPVMQTGSISNTPLFASIQAAQTPHRARISTGTRHGAPGRNRAPPLPRAPVAR